MARVLRPVSAIDPTGPLAADGSVVVVGAGLGGLRCAETLRALGFKGPITLVGDEPHLPYDRPPLTKQLLAGTWDEARIRLVTAEALEKMSIELVTGTAATSLDVEGRSVTLADGRRLGGDAVVLATGAAPRWLPGTEGAAGIHVVRTLAQGTALRDELARLAGRGRVIVIGGGFIGAEVASTAASASLDVTIVEALPVPLGPVVGDEVGAWIVELHRRAGIDVRAGVTIAAVEPATASGGPAVVLASGERLDADVVVIGIGVAPQTEWLDGSGLAVDNGVETDAALFAANGVVAVGDLARFTWHHAGRTELVRIEHWEVAAQLAAAAANSLVAGREHAHAVALVPYFWSDQHGRKLQMLGHPSGADDMSQVTGSLDEGKFTVLYHRLGRLTGVLGLASPRNVMICRTLVDAGAPIGEALALFA
jgi:3-phenylpropionate/trans-cinnamate dioxygenase ferredoxin reductase subunit